MEIATESLKVTFSLCSAFLFIALSVSGPASCQADEIYTFRSRTDETKWLSAYSAHGSFISSCLYMVTGPLWAVDLVGGADGTISYPQIQREIGGKQWQGGC